MRHWRLIRILYWTARGVGGTGQLRPHGVGFPTRGQKTHPGPSADDSGRLAHRDRSAQYENLSLACDRNKIGMTLGSATGESVTRRITGPPDGPEDAALTLNRFA